MKIISEVFNWSFFQFMVIVFLFYIAADLTGLYRKVSELINILEERRGMDSNQIYQVISNLDRLVKGVEKWTKTPG